MQELSQLWSVLGGDAGRLATVLAWVGALRLAVKPFAAVTQAKMNELLVKVAESSETDDDKLLIEFLSAPPYRWIAFMLDWLLSFKLPSAQQFKSLRKTE